MTVGFDGDMTIDAIAGGRTVTTIEALFPSLAAVIVATPAEIPETAPRDETTATVESLVDQLIFRSLRFTPDRVTATASSCTSDPTVMVFTCEVITIDATAGGSVIFSEVQPQTRKELRRLIDRCRLIRIY